MGTESAIVTTTPLVINIPANKVLNVHQLYHIHPTGGSANLLIKIGAEETAGLISKWVADLDEKYGAYVWPERPFKVAGPAQVTVQEPTLLNFLLHIRSTRVDVLINVWRVFALFPMSRSAYCRPTESERTD